MISIVCFIAPLQSSVPQEKFEDVEEKYKEAMVSNAQLYNEKTTLVFQVESLKDRRAMEIHVHVYILPIILHVCVCTCMYM